MSITISSSPATWTSVYVNVPSAWQALTFAIPAGCYSAATWATTADVTSIPKGNNGQIATASTDPAHIVLETPGWDLNEVILGYQFGAAATAQQLADINAAAGGSLPAWWRIYGGDSGSSTASVTQCLLILTPCVYAIAPGAAGYDLTGGSGSFAVTTESVCPWAAVSDQPWLTVTGSSTGQGAGTVSYTVAAWAQSCADPATRVGQITLPDGTAFIVTQTGCAYAVSPTEASYPWAGGAGTVTVTAQETCAWAATSDSDWITITAGSGGTGNGTVSYQVAAQEGQYGSPRTGTLTVACQTIALSQSGQVVSVVDLQSLPSPDSAAANQFITVTYPAGYLRTDLTPACGVLAHSFDVCRPRSQYLAYILPVENEVVQLVVTDSTGTELAEGATCPPVDVWRYYYV